MKDIREVLGRNQWGEGVIDGAEKVEDNTQKAGVWSLTITISGERYVADKCFLQTDDWEPRGGEKVRFDRQPEGVDDTYLYCTLVGE